MIKNHHCKANSFFATLRIKKNLKVLNAGRKHNADIRYHVFLWLRSPQYRIVMYKFIIILHLKAVINQSLH